MDKTESNFGGGFILRTVLSVMSHLVCLFEQGMGDFLNEMATMMTQSKPIVSLKPFFLCYMDEVRVLAFVKY